MKYRYNITGLTCNNCKTSVEKILNTQPGVKEVLVNLKESEVSIEMSQHISAKELQKSLPDKYSIFDKSFSIEKKSALKTLFPLILIFGYITISAVLLNLKFWNNKSFMLDFMGLFYIVFSFFKILDLKGFQKSFRMYDPLAKAIPPYAWIYPFIELILGILFLMRIKIFLALIGTLIILGITTIGVTKALLDKKEIQCACLGTVLKLPMTKATFIENSIMIVMAVIMLFNSSAL